MIGLRGGLKHDGLNGSSNKLKYPWGPTFEEDLFGFLNLGLATSTAIM